MPAFSPLGLEIHKNLWFVDFAGGRSDDGVFLAENPWEDPEIESAIKEENFSKLKEIIEKMDFSSSDDSPELDTTNRQSFVRETEAQQDSFGTLNGKKKCQFKII